MNFEFFALILAFNSCLVLGQQPSIRCTYFFSTENEYTCRMDIFNPDGLNNFTEINGTHLTNMANSDVQKVEVSDVTRNTLNFPSIICQTFNNAHIIDFTQAGIQIIDEDSFKNCNGLRILVLSRNRISRIDEKSFIENRYLTFLELGSNHITEVHENTFMNQHELAYLSFSFNNISDFADNTFKSLKDLNQLFLSSNRITRLKSSWFANLENLSTLYIYENPISNLPESVFVPLKKMWLLSAFSMNLSVIHSSSFGYLPNLNSIDFHNNQIDAFDERIIDNTSVGTLDMMSNLCSNDWMQDDSPSRENLRATMRICFENYRRLGNETTTSTPPTNPDCKVGNLDNRVCRLEDQFEEFEEDFHTDIPRLYTLFEDLHFQFQILRREKLAMEHSLTAAIEDLERQINELAGQS